MEGQPANEGGGKELIPAPQAVCISHLPVQQPVMRLSMPFLAPWLPKTSFGQAIRHCKVATEPCADMQSSWSELTPSLRDYEMVLYVAALSLPPSFRKKGSRLESLGGDSSCPT